MKNAVVTGGHSGIGKELVSLLESKGIVCKTPTSKEADLATAEGRACVSDLILQEKPDLLVHAAGFGLYGDSHTHPLAQQENMIAVHITACVHLTQTAVQMFLEEKKRGVVCNIASVSAHFPTPGMAVYGAAKAFMKSYSRSIDFEMKRHNIRVLTSCPGQVATPFAKKAAGKAIEQKGAMSVEYAAKQIFWQIQKRKSVHTFDWKYQLATLLPEKMLFKSIYKNLLARVRS